MWPKLLDMSRDECKRLLRRMELEAYAGIISAFRAQGALTDEKRKMLNDLCNMLSISTERHRAEIRRAVNDEKFATIAEHLSGSNTGSEWAIEGRRLIPLLPRLVPQTAFTIAANQAASMAQAHNMTLPPPAETARKEGATPGGSSQSNVKPARCPSPSSGVVVLPSGLSIPIKSPSDLTEPEIILPPPAKRKRSESGSSMIKSESQPPMGSSLISSPKPTPIYGGSMPSTSKITTGYVTQAMGAPSGQGSPVKITFTKGSGTPSQQTAPFTSSQKVIIVSSGSSSYTPTILQRSASHPASRALSTMSSGMHGGKQSVVLTTIAGQPSMIGPGGSGIGTVVSAGKTYMTTTTSTMDPSMAASKYRPKTFTKQKVVKPFSIIGGNGGPQGIAGPSGVTMTTASPTAAGKKPTIHIKQESAGVKIITQTIGNSGKIVPKPITIATTSGGSVVMVTCVPSSMVMAGKPIVTNAGSHGGPIRSIYGPGTRYVTNVTPTGVGGAKPSNPGSNVITVSPRALQNALAKGSTPSTVVVTKASGSGGHLGSGKANVIVVQKSQMLPKTVSIQRSLSSPEVQKHLLSGTSSLLTRPKISMVTTTPSLTSSIMSPTVRFPVPPHQARGQHSGVVTSSTSMMMTPVVGGQMQQGLSAKGPMTVGVIGGPKGGQDATSRAAQVVIRSKTSHSQPGLPTRRRSGSPATAPFLEFPSQLTPVEGERLARVTVQRRSASVSPTLSGQNSPGIILDEGGTVPRVPSKDHPGQVPMLFHTVSARQPNREWIDYDGNPPEQSASSAIKALLEFRAQPQSADGTKRQTTLDLTHMGRVPLNQTSKLSTMATHPSNRPMAQHITVKKGAITGPLPGPMRPAMQRSNTPPTTTSPSVFTGSQTMMTAQQFQRKQDMRRPPSTPFLHSATLEVEKALQEQNKAQQSRELSASLPQLIHPKIQPREPPRQQPQQPKKAPNSGIVTVEEQGVVSEQIPLSPAEVNSFIDQFERFLESEGLESEMEGSEKLLAHSRAQAQRELMEKAGKPGRQVPKSVAAAVAAAVASGEADPRGGVKEMGSVSPGVKAGSGASVAVGQMGSVSGSAVGLSGNQNLTWQDTYAQAIHQQQQAPQKTPASQSKATVKPTTTTTTDSPGIQTPSTSTETTPAVIVETAQKRPQFSTLHEMLSKGKGAAVEVVTSAGQAKPSTSVVVESSRFDMSQMKMEDFTSQRLQDDFDVTMAKQDDIRSTSSSPTPSQKSPARSEGGPDIFQTGSGSQSEESLSSVDAQLGIRSSKRKRKAPVPIDEDIGPMCMPSWARAALNLLHRVMRFRGANRSKGDLNAASWFTRPVDPSEAPGYMQLIKIPMDFSTIKKKLENNQYNDLSEFHDDMMLVRGNCHLYNPPGHEARKDCEEVFQFYTAEYGKVLDRMQKALQFNTPKSPKKIKGESPTAPISPTKQTSSGTTGSSSST